jgi:hypothetical protein
MSLMPPLTRTTSFLPKVLPARKASICSVMVSVAALPAASGLAETRALPRAYDKPPEADGPRGLANEVATSSDQLLMLLSLTV